MKRILYLLDQLSLENEELRGLINEHLDEYQSEESREFVEGIFDSLESIDTRIPELRETVESFEIPDSPEDYRESPKQERNSERSLSALATLGILRGEYEAVSYSDFRRRRRQRINRRKFRTVRNFISQRILPLVKRVSSYLFDMISQLTTPKGWSVRGGIGSNMLFFQGNVSLSIHFGK